MDFPKTGTLYNTNLNVYQGRLGNAPLPNQAFSKVQSAIDELNEIGLSKLQIDRVRQCFLSTAIGENLDDPWGVEYNVPRKLATQSELTITVSATSGTVIPSGTMWLGTLNKITYQSYSSVTAGAGNTASINVLATVSGTDGNLQISDKMEIQSSITGLLLTTSTVSAIVTTAADKEEDDDYRIRISDKKDNPGDGGTSSFYRNAGQEVTGVARVYPYSGNTDPTISVPGQVVVYVRVNPDIQADGIAPNDILIEVKNTILINPVTGKERRDLGVISSLLYVVSITRLTVYTQIRGLVITGTISQSDLLALIDDAITLYMSNKEPYIVGLDSQIKRNSMITSGELFATVQPILNSNSATITGIDFRFTLTGAFQGAYNLSPGELPKNSGVSLA